MALNGYMFDFAISSERSKICPRGTENGLFTVSENETFVRCAGFHGGCLFGRGAQRWPCVRERGAIAVAALSRDSFDLHRVEGNREPGAGPGATLQNARSATHCTIVGG
jgi:hypothetical protein